MDRDASDEIEPVPMPGMDEETADAVSAEMARRIAWGLSAVPDDDWDD